MPSHIKPLRLNRLPDLMRRELIEARRKQMHVSGIETGKIVPRFDTLLDIVRVLDRDLLLVPQALVPAVQALIRDHRSQESGVAAHDGDRPLYASVDEEEDERADEA